VNALRVLVAEDNEDFRALVVLLLNAEFHVVGDVRNGQLLVEAAVFLKPDVIVSDILMPIMGGISARTELIGRGLDYPFVFMTLLKVGNAVRGKSEGRLGYVHKIDLASELNAAVRAVYNGEPYLSKSFRTKS